MDRSKHIRSPLCVVFVSAGLSLFVAVPLWGQPGEPTQTDAGGVIRGRGIIVPTAYEEIRYDVGQPLAVLFMAPSGAQVKKGDLLVELDAMALMDQRREQEVRVAKAQGALATVEASLPGARQEATEAVAIGEKALGLARRQLEAYRAAEYPGQEIAATNEVTLAQERAVRLRARSDELEHAYKEQGTKSLEQELLEVRLASIQAQMELFAAENKLQLLKEIARPRRTEELELAVAQKEFELLHAKNELDRITKQGEIDIRIAQIVHEMKKDRLLLLEHQIQSSKLFAPRDGTVFAANEGSIGAPSEAEVRPGDTARPRQVLLRLADLTQLKLDVPLSPAQAQKLAPGHSATIRCDVFPGRTFHGHATGTRVSTNIDAAGNPAPTVVTVRLDDPITGLRPGIMATVEFDISGAK